MPREPICNYALNHKTALSLDGQGRQTLRSIVVSHARTVHWKLELLRNIYTYVYICIHIHTQTYAYLLHWKTNNDYQKKITFQHHFSSRGTLIRHTHVILIVIDSLKFLYTHILSLYIEMYPFFHCNSKDKTNCYIHHLNYMPLSILIIFDIDSFEYIAHICTFYLCE